MYRLSTSSNNQSWLTWFLRGLLFLGVFILVARLVDLQIIKGEYYRSLSEGNRINRIKLKAERGNIYARGGEIISGSDFAHITGYLSETNESEVGKIDPRCLEKGPYKLGQIVGRGGLQEEYNCILSGVDGEELVEVNSVGEKIRTIGIRKPISGNNLHTNIDYNLQKKVANEMKDKVGSVVITDKNGKVLSLFSSPTFDPNNVLEALDDPNLPLFNRAIGGIYHPGSVFKPVISIIGLEEGKIDSSFKYNDTGVVTVESQYGNYSYTNWYFTQYGGKEGEIDLTVALARSTDTFFYKLGEFIGINKMVDWMKTFGLTKLTEVDVAGEVLNLIPSPDWKERVKKEKWFLGNTYHFAIGQGDLAVTPISMHRADLVIANGGKLCSLKIVGDTKCIDLKIEKSNLSLVEAGMKKVCSAAKDGNPNGTAYTFFDFKEKSGGVEVACKTGTAETNEDGKNHAWFVAYNIENNKVEKNKDAIFVTVMVEKSGEGSKVAGPIAREIFDHYFGMEEEGTINE